jgi:hypothetical protein
MPHNVMPHAGPVGSVLAVETWQSWQSNRDTGETSRRCGSLSPPGVATKENFVLEVEKLKSLIASLQAEHRAAESKFEAMRSSFEQTILEKMEQERLTKLLLQNSTDMAADAASLIRHLRAENATLRGALSNPEAQTTALLQSVGERLQFVALKLVAQEESSQTR